MSTENYLHSQGERFNEGEYLNYVEALVEADEPERALKAFDNVPGYFRLYPTPAMQKLKQEILAAICTPNSYCQDGHDNKIRDIGNSDILMKMMRGKLLFDELEKYNSKGITPHLIDFGPGEYLIPLSYRELDLNFSYEPIWMDQTAHAAYLNHLNKATLTTKSGPTIFIGWEIIEHLKDPKELATEALAHNGGVWPEQVHLSTPCFAYDSRKKQWRKKAGLPHLRTYTPHEFIFDAQTCFPGYGWTLYVSPILSLVGKLSD